MSVEITIREGDTIAFGRDAIDDEGARAILRNAGFVWRGNGVDDWIIVGMTDSNFIDNVANKLRKVGQEVNIH